MWTDEALIGFAAALRLDDGLFHGLQRAQVLFFSFSPDFLFFPLRFPKYSSGANFGWVCFPRLGCSGILGEGLGFLCPCDDAAIVAPCFKISSLEFLPYTHLPVV